MRLQWKKVASDNKTITVRPRIQTGFPSDEEAWSRLSEELLLWPANTWAKLTGTSSLLHEDANLPDHEHYIIKMSTHTIYFLVKCIHKHKCSEKMR